MFRNVEVLLRQKKKKKKKEKTGQFYFTSEDRESAPL